MKKGTISKIISSQVFNMFFGALISAAISFVILGRQLQMDKKLAIYSSEISSINDIRDAASELVVTIYPYYLYDVVNKMKDDDYIGAREIVSTQFNEYNASIVRFNVVLRTYKGTSDEYLNEFSDAVNMIVSYYGKTLNLAQRMCTLVFDKERFLHFGDFFAQMYGDDEDENRILDEFKNTTDMRSPILPASFVIYLAEKHKMDGVRESIDRELMMAIGHSIYDYRDSLERILLGGE